MQQIEHFFPAGPSCESNCHPQSLSPFSRWVRFWVLKANLSYCCCCPNDTKILPGLGSQPQEFDFKSHPRRGLATCHAAPTQPGQYAQGLSQLHRFHLQNLPLGPPESSRAGSFLRFGRYSLLVATQPSDFSIAARIIVTASSSEWVSPRM